MAHIDPEACEKALREGIARANQHALAKPALNEDQRLVIMAQTRLSEMQVVAAVEYIRHLNEGKGRAFVQGLAYVMGNIVLNVVKDQDAALFLNKLLDFVEGGHGVITAVRIPVEVEDGGHA